MPVPTRTHTLFVLVRLVHVVLYSRTDFGSAGTFKIRLQSKIDRRQSKIEMREGPNGPSIWPHVNRSAGSTTKPELSIAEVEPHVPEKESTSNKFNRCRSVWGWASEVRVQSSRRTRGNACVRVGTGIRNTAHRVDAELGNMCAYVWGWASEVCLLSSRRTR